MNREIEDTSSKQVQSQPSSAQPAISAQERRLRVAVVASMKRGLEQFIFREVRELFRCGAEVTLLPTKQGRGLYEPPPQWKVCRWKKLAVVLCQPLRAITFGRRYLSALKIAIQHNAVGDFLLAAFFASKIREVDVVYATFGDRKFFVAYFCRQLLRIPLAVEIHAYELYMNPNPSLFRKALAECEQVISISEFNRDYLTEHYGVDPDKIDVVRCSVDLSDFKPEKKFVILIVAFFVEKKGHEILFKAIKSLNRKDFEVWVVGGLGGASGTVDVQGMVGRLGIADQVAFFGRLKGTALKAVYHACDVFCLPSRVDSNGDSEGFPTVIIEAMACGKPVVTTRHVEIPRIVERLLVDENDVEGLAAALLQASESRELREEMGVRNRELAEQHFCSSNVQRTFNHLRRISAEGQRLAETH